MIELHNISLYDEISDRILLENFSFSLAPKEHFAIIGEEGNGKSTLLKLIKEPQLIMDYCQFSGEIHRHQAKVAFLSQELTLTEQEQSITDLFSEVNWTTDLLNAMAEFKIESLISEKLLSDFSGGEQFKYRFLRLLADDPDVLLLDEPTNNLDLRTIEWLESFIKQTSLPVLYVSHDETFIQQTATGIIHLEQRHNKQVPVHTITRVSYDSYQEERQRQLAKQEQLAKKQGSDYQKQLNKWQHVWQKAENQHQNVARSDPRLQKKIKLLKNQKQRLERQTSQFVERPYAEEGSVFRFAEANSVHQQKEILNFRLTELTVAQRVLANNIHLRVVGPEKIAIIGTNGIGKTSLLKEIHQHLLENTNLKVGYMPQNYAEVLDNQVTASEFLVPSGDKDERTQALTLLASMNFTRDEMFHQIKELSGGQQGKLLLLKMILEDCDVLLLDEPTRNFSPLTTPALFQSLEEFSGAIISISHDRAYLKEVVEKVYRLTPDGLVVDN